MILILQMIDAAAREMRVSLTEKQIEKLIKRIRKNSDKIGNLKSYLRTAVINASALPDSEDEGFPAAYDIDLYNDNRVLSDDEI